MSSTLPSWRRGVYSSEHILDWCKWLHARNGISIILIGLSRLRYLFEKDDQLDRRWNAELRLSEYWWQNADGNDDIESQSMFMAILAAYRDVFQIPFDIDVEDEVVAFRFFYASQGLFGNLKKLMKEASGSNAAESPSTRAVIAKMVLVHEEPVISSITKAGVSALWRRTSLAAMELSYPNAVTD